MSGRVRGGQTGIGRKGGDTETGPEGRLGGMLGHVGKNNVAEIQIG